MLTDILKDVKIYITPDPKELPLPNFNLWDSVINPEIWYNKDRLILFVSEDQWSDKLLEDLSINNKLDDFEIVYYTSGVPEYYKDIKILGFPTIYCRKTKTSHLGYTDYNRLMSFFKLS